MDKNVIKQWILAGDSVKSISDAAAAVLDEIEQEKKNKIQEAKLAIINAYDAYSKLLNGKGLTGLCAKRLQEDLDLGIVGESKDYISTREERNAETGTNPEKKEGNKTLIKDADKEFNEAFKLLRSFGIR